MRNLYKYMGMALALILGLMLISTIYFTLFDLQWLAFLAGVLFAAVSAMTSQTAKAQWLVARRTRQLERNKEQLALEITRRELAAAEFAAAEAGFRLVGDALPAMIACVDREERCSYHNRAFGLWCGRSSDRIDNLPLRDVVGNAIYEDVKSRGAEALAGKEVRYDTEWPHHGSNESVAVTLLPYPPGAAEPAGFYVVMAKAGAAAAAQPAGAPADSVGNVVIVSQESGETVYLESMTEQLIGGSDPRDRLVQALQEDQFILFAQKIKPLAANAPDPHCFEVLLRMQEEEDHMLPPGGFFPVAERYNLMGEIDRWVVRNLLKRCAGKKRDDPAWRMPLYCVNLCGATLCDIGFPRYVESELERYAVPAGNLCFEIAEPDLLDHYRDVHALMRALRPLGCRFTADAFGSVKVSFAPFRELKFDFVKIDGIIIQNMLREQSDLAKTRAIALACRKIGVRTIAEFVETEETLARLRDIGIDYAQGFGIGKPEPLA
jgi:EAL domain-containing protein (putative c-di-GMP-specific phosphodiesterase class I)/PAS domain-containing protein